VLARQDGRSGGAGVDLAAKDRSDEIRALWEMTVDGGDAHAGPAGDLAHGRVDAGRREDGFGCLQ